MLGFASLFLVYVNQSEKRFALADLFKFKDKVIWYVNAGIIVILMLVIYTPVGQDSAGTVPLGLDALTVALGIAFVSTIWWEFVKLLKYILKKNTLFKGFDQ